MPYNLFDCEYTGKCLFGNLIMFDCEYQGAMPWYAGKKNSSVTQVYETRVPL